MSIKRSIENIGNSGAYRADFKRYKSIVGGSWLDIS